MKFHLSLLQWKNSPCIKRDVCFSIEKLRPVTGDAIAELEQHVVAYAVDMQKWYQRNKSRKRTLSKFIRFFAIASLVVGGLYPVIAHLTQSNAYLGYIILGAAGGLYILDRMFDISSSWMRDITAMQSIDRAIYTYQLQLIKIDFESDGSENVHPYSRLKAIETLAGSVFDAVTIETTEWRSAFENAIVDLEKLVKPEERISSRHRDPDDRSSGQR